LLDATVTENIIVNVHFQHLVNFSIPIT